MSGGDYPKTTWGMLRNLDPTREGFAAGIETLCRRYREPIRHYVRASWASTDEDAEDLTQDFFLWLMDGSALRRYASELGSFRNFLKGLLRNFGRNHLRKARRQRRGGGRAPSALDPETLVDRGAEAAEAALDRAFAREITARAMEAARARLEASGRAVQWRVFEELELRPASERPSYRELASRHGVSETEVRNGLHRVRELIREEIRRELATTVDSDAELEAEWRHVIG